MYFIYVFFMLAFEDEQNLVERIKMLIRKNSFQHNRICRNFETIRITAALFSPVRRF